VQIVCAGHTSVKLVSTAKNDVSKGLNFRFRAMVAVRIGPQLQLLRLAAALGFEGLQSGLEWKLSEFHLTERSLRPTPLEWKFGRL
jgi:hypothetical protein